MLKLLLILLPSSHDALWIVCVCASTRVNPPKQNIILTILKALSLACAKWSIGSMQVSFLMALARVPVRELFNNIGFLVENEGPSSSSMG